MLSEMLDMMDEASADDEVMDAILGKYLPTWGCMAPG
jgi:DNA-binding ferritin-like protein (Dps family)